MNEYDIIKLYEQMERELVRSMMRNLKRHQKEEEKVGFKFSQWQAEKLRSLQKYRKENKHIIEAYTKGLNKEVAEMLSGEIKKGKLEAFKGYEDAIKNGYEAKVDVPAKFFKTNSRKANTFIKVINNDLNKANHAALRRSNDIYREVIHKAFTFVGNGVYTERKAVDMAIKEFKEKGINCIVYKNGAKHTISDYSAMAIRTANQRAQLMGEGEFRKKIGETLVIVSKHGTACKICQEFENRVFVDDVYSGGTAEDGKYPLLSQAMKEGMFHPNCRHGLNTYYEGITEVEGTNVVDIKEQQQDEVIKETPKAKVIEEESYTPITAEQKAKLNSIVGRLPKRQRDAVTWYTGKGYEEVNNALRYGTTTKKGIAAKVEAISNAIGENTIGENTILYRGMRSIPAQLLEGLNDEAIEILKNYQKYDEDIVKNIFRSLEGIEFTEKGFISTTVDEYTGKMFATDFVKDINYYFMELKVNKNVRGLYVETISEHRLEKEFLIDSNYTIVIEKAEYIHDKNFKGVKLYGRIVEK